jgi:hypothetical protein
MNHLTLRFYANKTLLLERGFRCYYTYLGFAPEDLEAAFNRLAEFKVRYFISLEESAMPQPPSILNRVSLDILRRVENDPRFVREPFESESGFVVFKHVGPWEGEL